ncbi:MAG: DUF4870 domain-containing protein [Anaerolineae bacterium]|nr:DUF4870 domain-containing protein [Anaerolineae bacterium]
MTGVAVPTTDNRDERLLAALAHALILINFVGAVGAAVIFALNRERSRYVAFQAAQAAVYQLAGFLLTVGCWVCWTVGYLGSLVPLMADPSAYPEPPWFFWAGMASMVLPLAFMGLLWLYGLWGAVQAFRGRPFRYLLIGPWLGHYLLDQG